jgi:sterol desaturase/sphingolipid hydroxylase (fatty acid hydroxylase superfamily)
MPVNTALYIFLGIYLAAITAESVYSHFAKRELYSFRDSIVNFFLGASAIAIRALTKGVSLALWFYLYRFSFFKIPANIWSWTVLFLLNELVYYWFHRLSHENKILWAVHVNHHSSEKLNFSTAARVPFFNFILHNIFWIPLLFAGFDPAMIFAVESIGFLFAFFQHTQVIKKIPFVGFILNTPSHHRVHHASNIEYQNKNYGNVLIIFDRIFGTFKKETPDVKIKYGINENIKSYNPVKVIFHEWSDLFTKRKRTYGSNK